MQTLTAQVVYVNQPKSPKGPGSIKTADGEYLKVWPRDLWLFTPGKTYEIKYTSEDYKGEEQKTAKDAKEIGVTNGGVKPAPGKPQNFVKPDTSITDAERIFVCGALNNAIHAQQVNVTSVTEVVAAGRALREAFRVIFLNPQYAKDLNDEIPH